MKTIERIINFYELSFLKLEQDDYESGLTGIFQKIIKRNNDESKIKFQNHSNYLIGTKDIVFLPDEKMIRGKILKISMDSFPEIIDTNENIIRDIEVSDSDGLVETTHFVINYVRPKQLILAIEHNQQGGKPNDFQRYINSIIQELGLPNPISFDSYIKDELESFIRRIQRCAFFRVKVKKENIPYLEEVNASLYTSLNAAQELGKSDTVEIILNYNLAKGKDTVTIRNLVKNMVSYLSHNRSFSSHFENLEVRAEDDDNHRRMELFDLLSDKLKSVVRVERRERAKVIISADMFNKLQDELNRHFK